MSEKNKLYSTSISKWYPLLTPVHEYEKEAGIYKELFLKHNSGIKTILEMGCGAGHNAFYLKKAFKMTLTDVSSEMLALSEKINPECEHLSGDMRTVRLNRFFDAVFIHDAISYITNDEDLLLTFSSVFNHLRPGGCALFVPDYFQDTYTPETSHGGIDDNRTGMRYLEWTHAPEPGSNTIIKDFAFLLKDESGNVEVEYDRHILGLFSKSSWISMLEETGFQAEIISVPYHEEGIDTLYIVYGIKATLDKDKERF